MKTYLKIIFSFLLAFSFSIANATHIRAGEITAEVLSPIDLSYRYTLVLYTSNTGPSISPDAELTFSDGTSSGLVTHNQPATQLGNNVTVMIFHFNKKWDAPGIYTARYQEFNRVGGVLNMSNSGSSPFYLETMITIDPFLGSPNNSSQLTVPPIDYGATNQVYNYNPGAFDQDGDSIAYEMVVPLQDSGIQVFNYVSPANPSFTGGNNTFNLDPITGTIIWDYPVTAGLYNIAYKIKEFRNGTLIGYIHRDMQITIIETNNIKPELIFPQKACYIAGDSISELIIANDVDGDNIEITAFGGVMTSTISLASFNQTVFNNPAEGVFTWVPACGDVRHQPYQIIFKADDGLSNNPSLVDIETWEIDVYGPSPTNFTSTPNTDASISLNWDNYKCGNAIEMGVWRKDCSEPTTISCDDDLANYGYEKIATVPINTTTYKDDNDGVGLKSGRSYCYRLVAEFPVPKAGSSIPSEETCEFTEDEQPFMLNVDIEKTSFIKGEIFVRWTNRITGGTGPKYRLYRGEGENPTTYDVLSITTPQDTFFLDTDLNTEEIQYSYKAQITGAKESNHASSVWLDSEVDSKRVDLSWSADVPWSIASGEHHLIYRMYEAAGDADFILIDSILVNNYQKMVYTDTGQYQNISLSDQDSVCYYVVTKGTYCNDLVDDNEILINRSQRICVLPIDTTGPCPPELFIESDCVDKLENFLHWTSIIEPDPCTDDIDYFEIHNKRLLIDEYIVIATTVDTLFLHDSLEYVSGCYKVRGIDNNGNIGKFSDSVCVLDCPNFILPNVFTPNGDLENSLFKPIPPLRGVKNVILSVYNRWGRRVYDYKGSPEINWDGGELNDGIYYYKVEVEYYNLFEAKEMLNGWVQIIR